MQNRSVRKTLITDLDNCAFTINQEVNGKLLSRRLVEHARSGEYAEFYVCTHRDTTNFQINLKEPFVEIKKHIAYIRSYDQAAIVDTYQKKSYPVVY